MNITGARYLDADGLQLAAVVDGVEMTIPAVAGNRHYEGIVAAGIVVSPYLDPPPDAADVRAEASRRMRAVTGARDAGHLSVLISNASREAIRLLRIKAERPWTAEEAARAAALEAADAAIEAIRAASNTLEAMQPVPADYRDDGRWP